MAVAVHQGVRAFSGLRAGQAPGEGAGIQRSPSSTSASATGIHSASVSAGVKWPISSSGNPASNQDITSNAGSTDNRPSSRPAVSGGPDACPPPSAAPAADGPAVSGRARDDRDAAEAKDQRRTGRQVPLQVEPVGLARGNLSRRADELLGHDERQRRSSRHALTPECSACTRKPAVSTQAGCSGPARPLRWPGPRRATSPARRAAGAVNRNRLRTQSSANRKANGTV